MGKQLVPFITKLGIEPPGPQLQTRYERILFIEDHTSSFFVQTKWLTTERANKKIPAYHHFASNIVLID
jgi:hypothetical protein